MTELVGRPLKILHIITEMERGGAETMLSQLAIGLKEFGIESEVICLTRIGQLGEGLRQSKVPVTALGLSKPSEFLSGIRQLVRKIRGTRPNIIQTWLYHGDLLGTISGKLSFGSNRILWNIRCSDAKLSGYSTTARLSRKVLPYLSHFVSGVISNSEAGISAHQALGYRPPQWICIPNAVNTEKFFPDPNAREKWRRELNIDSKTLLVGMVARLEENKNHPDFLEAARLLTKKLPQTRFLLVGRGISNLSNVSNREDLILLEEQADIPGILNALDLFTLTSSSEGFPNVVAEAMATALPVVVTRAGDAEKIVGDSSKVVSPGSPEILSQTWHSVLIQTAEERRKIGDQNRARIVKEFSPQKITKEYAKLYTSMAESVRDFNRFTV